MISVKDIFIINRALESLDKGDEEDAIIKYEAILEHCWKYFTPQNKWTIVSVLKKFVEEGFERDKS